MKEKIAIELDETVVEREGEGRGGMSAYCSATVIRVLRDNEFKTRRSVAFHFHRVCVCVYVYNIYSRRCSVRLAEGAEGVQSRLCLCMCCMSLMCTSTRTTTKKAKSSAKCERALHVGRDASVSGGATPVWCVGGGGGYFAFEFGRGCWGLEGAGRTRPKFAK